MGEDRDISVIVEGNVLGVDGKEGFGGMTGGSGKNEGILVRKG
ncbi:MAG: hypothetical protein BWY17_00938 [Deltaproteobacteria bacterium ADurb.Bin207]|jgi:hypothetical protein|nr:MAG: hypothetical protein BWY17_00938 [Deltaproteobacteria bacterium ADurb.Bin207]